jgi:hypothetical protein
MANPWQRFGRLPIRGVGRLTATAERPKVGRIAAIVAVVVVVIIVAVGVFVVVIGHTAKLSPATKTSDASYCSLAKTIPFTREATGVQADPSLLPTALFALPKSGPSAVNADVLALRDQLTNGDYTAAVATAKRLDGQTATVCP